MEGGPSKEQLACSPAHNRQAALVRMPWGLRGWLHAVCDADALTRVTSESLLLILVCLAVCRQDAADAPLDGELCSQTDCNQSWVRELVSSWCSAHSVQAHLKTCCMHTAPPQLWPLSSTDPSTAACLQSKDSVLDVGSSNSSTAAGNTHLTCYAAGLLGTPSCTCQCRHHRCTQAGCPCQQQHSWAAGTAEVSCP